MRTPDLAASETLTRVADETRIAILLEGDGCWDSIGTDTNVTAK